jgi:hypothetical protein
MRYRPLGGNWVGLSIEGVDLYRCDPRDDPAYNLQWNGPESFITWGYDTTGPGCKTTLG